MFMLESHLSAPQSRVIAQVQAAAAELAVNVFLTGGALRDMLAGFPIVEIDFTVEGSGIKLGRAVAASSGAQILDTDENRKSALLLFDGGVRVSIGMARQEKFPKPGAKPQVKPCTIHEDLRGRDFTVNSIALSLNAASRGLLLDPNNGVGDIERKELRTVTNFTLYDDPIRLLRLHRFKVRLGLTVVDRTLAQYANSREAELETKITPAALLDELRRIASEQNVGELVRVLNEEKLLPLFSPALKGDRVNLEGIVLLDQAKHLIPFGADLQVEHLGVFLSVLAEKLTPAERLTMVKHLGMSDELAEQWLTMDARSRKLEKNLKAPKLQKPSALYNVLVKAPGDQIMFLLVQSEERLVQDRIRNYLEKYLPMALEVTDGDVLALGVAAGTPKFEKAKAELIATRLDAKPKKLPDPEDLAAEAPPEPPPPTKPLVQAPPFPSMHAFARSKV